MAAVLPFLETEEFHFPEEIGDPDRHGGLAGLGAKGKGKGKIEQTEAQLIAASNVEMTRLYWTRIAMQKALAGRTFQLVRVTATKAAIELRDPSGEKLSRFPAYAVPWAGLTSDTGTISLFSTNSKMRCPTWDLPAGSATVGGACPGATPAQTTSLGDNRTTPDKAGGIVTKVGDRYVLRVTPDVPFDLARSVCGSCYATGGTYANTSTQLTEIVHYSVMQAAMSNPTLLKALEDVMVWQIPLLDYDGLLENGVGETNEDTVKRMREIYGDACVVRIHSSGDFFSPDYARFWLRIARRLYSQYGMKYRLWAPTRTHVLPKFRAFWADKNPKTGAGVIPPNFTIRPSAYGLGDYAPEAPRLAAGTSVLVEEDSAASKGVKFDHQCGVYALGKGEKSCVDAVNPNNERGCRACWVHPELRVNYVAH